MFIKNIKIATIILIMKNFLELHLEIWLYICIYLKDMKFDYKFWFQALKGASILSYGWVSACFKNRDGILSGMAWLKNLDN